MEYQEFLQTIKEKVSKQVPSGCYVELNTVIKNNDQKLDAIIITGEDSQIAPNIYLNRYYEEFSNGRELDSILKEIISDFYTNRGKDFEAMPNILDFNSISKQISYRLINLEMNRERLTDLPHQVIEDMAKIYYIVVKSDSDGIGSVAITNDFLKKWKVDIDCINNLAYKNTPSLFPEKLKSLSEIMKEIISKQYGELVDQGNSSENKVLYEQILEQLNGSNRAADNEEMYVLSNVMGINGASAMLYPGILHNFAIDNHSNFYILPSSIHEVILVPVHRKLSKEALRQMVMEVNASQVPIEEVLSNEVYYFDLATDKFHIAKDV